MENRTIESGLGGDRRIGVHRIVVAAQPIDQRLPRQSWYLDHRVGCSVGKCGRRRKGSAPTAAAAVAAQKIGRLHTADEAIIFVVDDTFLEEYDGALLKALIVDTKDLI